MGETSLKGGSSLAQLSTSQPDGCFLNEKTWGTYLHGIFDNVQVIQSILKSCGKETQLQEFDYNEYKNKQYDKLAALLRESCDMEYVYRVLKESDQ
jgi:adenosylcobyric acid synthase